MEATLQPSDNPPNRDKGSKMHYIETQKIKVEIEKMKSEMFWQPFKIAATVITAVAALTATITTLIIKFM